MKNGDRATWWAGEKLGVGVVDRVVPAGEFVPGVSVAVPGPAARVRVIRNGTPTDDYVAVPINKLVVNAGNDKVAAPRSIRKTYGIRSANTEDLKLINKMLPAGAPPRTEADTVIIPFVAADNLLNRGLDKWDKDSLKTMAQLAPGLPMLLDHDWDEVGKVWGKVFRANYEEFDTAPTAAINSASNGKINREIIKDEGFGQVVVEAFSEPNNPVVTAITSGKIGKVSTGGFEFSDYHCPHCKTSFRDEDCEHYVPDKNWGITRDRYPEVADYAIRVGLSDLGEISVVTIPNLPQAGVI